MAHQYKKHSQRTHVLELPDTYVGSIETNEEPRWVYNAESGKMVHRTLKFNPGLFKLFDETIVNAYDEYIRSSMSASRAHVKNIDVVANIIDGVFTIKVKNDGDGIPLEIHPTEKMYVPELIFGNLLTSSNYNKEEEKITGGKNGLGVKLANIFSTKFMIHINDPSTKQSYSQTWKNNMEICEKPVLKKSTNTKGYVEVEFQPDLKRFGYEKVLSEDMKDIFHTRVLEIAALLGKNVKVSYNGADVKTDTFEKLVKLFLDEESEKSYAYEKAGDRWEVAAVLTSSLFSDDTGTNDSRHVSFVNSVNTYNGGKHIEYVSKQILEAICEVALKKKKLTIKAGQLKDHVTFFVNSTIVNPSFSSQSKQVLTTASSKFGSTPKFTDKIVNSLVKAGILEQAQAIMDAKLGKDAKKTDGSKKKTIRGLPKLEDALWAGTTKSSECTLILTEGDSAATSAIAGLKVVGRERWGVFPLKGKLLNVKDISREKFNANEELTNIKKIIGLEQGKRYTSASDLRYGRVMVMSDQDVDGFHIRGLLMNLFHTEWPTLMQVGFLCTIMTPLVKMTKGTDILCFYNDAEVDAWRAQVGEDVAKKYKSKYYKGLGTSTPAEAREWFENLSEVKYEWDGKTNDSIELAFNKKRADDRKEWLGTYDPKKSLIVPTDRIVPYSQFVHEELIHFSNADNIRSLPHVMDGLKPSQRKILYSCFKRNLRSEIRVAQLAGYVSEHAAYHHGEASLNQTITSMGQIFVGANNINMLKPIGQFGCLAPDTPILMWNGEIKNANEVIIGDELVGDNGMKRTVLKTTSGIDDMYEVVDYKGKKLEVNSQHILTLYYKQNFDIQWKESHQAWHFNYFDGTTIKTVSVKVNQQISDDDHFNKSKTTKEEGFINISKKCDELKNKYSDSTIIDIKIEDYLKLANYHKRKMYMVSNLSNIEWEHQDVPIDPYILGVWLGDGDSRGKGFTTADEEIIKSFVKWGKSNGAEVVHHSNENHDGYHYLIRRKGAGYLPAVGSEKSNKSTCNGCVSSTVEIKHDACSWKCDDGESIVNPEFMSKCIKYNLNPFTQLLRDNNLYMNKHIPINYMINDKNTRLQLLAGFIDTDGTVKDNNTSNAFIEISQSKRLHANLIHSLEFIAKSLGYATSVYNHGKKNLTKKGEDSSILTLRIMGTNLDEIHTVLKGKQIVYNGERIKTTNHYTSFEVNPLGKGRFCGWSIDGNERFLLGNFVVTHNSRLQGGADSASPRYIHANLEQIVDAIFKKEDSPLLKYTIDDGDAVEPETYLPVVPLLAINGSVGIGTGFSTNIPPHNPRHIVALLKQRLASEISSLAGVALDPWWVGFRGGLIRREDKQWITKALYEFDDSKNTITITELPVGTWTKDYKVFLDKMAQAEGPETKYEGKPMLKNFDDLYNDVDVNFILYLDKEYYDEAKDNRDDFEKRFHLTTSWKTTNMCCFDNRNNIIKYGTIGDLLEEFFVERLTGYDRRRAWMIAHLKDRIEELEAVRDFVRGVVAKTLNIMNVEDDVLLASLKAHNLPPRSDRESPDTLKAYEYLLRMRVDRIKKSSIVEAERDVEKALVELKVLEETSIIQMWGDELDQFLSAWDKHEAMMLHIMSAGAGIVTASKKKIIKRATK